jgi:hypothetical protein
MAVVSSSDRVRSCRGLVRAACKGGGGRAYGVGRRCVACRAGHGRSASWNKSHG